MQMISIDYILECMNDEKNYFGDIWEKCLNNKKRFNRSKLKEILKKMEILFLENTINIQKKTMSHCYQV
jgi:hypothetical protein